MVIPSSRDGQGLRAIARRPTLPQEVLRHLLEAVQRGDLAAGDRLPPERELCEILGISRPSLREALQALAMLGLIVSTPGRGTYLSESLASLPYEPYLFQLLMSRGKLTEFMELRAVLEPEIAAFAAVRASDEQRERIKEAFIAYRASVADGVSVETEAQAGSDFHLSLAHAAGNDTLLAIITSVSDLLNETGRSIISRSSGCSLEYHEQIFQAIWDRDPERARLLMRAHLEEVEGHLLEAWSTNGSTEQDAVPVEP